MMRIYPFDWIGYCYDKAYRFMLASEIKFNMPFCGKQICSTSGDWYIAWAIPANGSLQMANAYMYAALVLPLLYGSWKLELYHVITGPMLSFFSTSNMNEWAAVWCLYSIGLLLLLIKTPVRNYLHITRWYGLRIPVFLGGTQSVKKTGVGDYGSFTKQIYHLLAIMYPTRNVTANKIR